MPGHIGIFDFIAKSRATSLLPIDLIDAGLGPIQVIPELITSWAKRSFSERKPKPG